MSQNKSESSGYHLSAYRLNYSNLTLNKLAATTRPYYVYDYTFNPLRILFPLQSIHLFPTLAAPEPTSTRISQ